MLNSLLTFFKKEQPPVVMNKAGLNLSDLKNYIFSKMGCRTAFEIGKLRLALYLEDHVEQKIKDKDIDYDDLQKDFYIAYMVNEYLERPGRYEGYKVEGTNEPIKSVFKDRFGMQELLAESKDLGVDLYSAKEMKALFELFKTMLHKVSVPHALPEYIKSGSESI